ncbi:hypothetical protein SAY87_014739 [Trapa incisa]|uniref:Mediator of RNA polymerase II transcription subunit 33A n=1 Tax=Trapa incisa TaxID=236973 RepID=A0AAN7GNR4_9MYRT|nr:hypothetical protein SAY87_014739 [Trapa incisa]
MRGDAAEFERDVLERVNCCVERKDPPLMWSVEISKLVAAAGVELPSPELGQVLVSELCSNFSSPSLWKMLEQALASRLVSSFHVLSLLFPRVLSHRKSQPEAFRLFLELISRYIFSYEAVCADACKQKIIKSVDATMQFYQDYGVNVTELGHAYVLFFFSTFHGLIDCSLEDCGLQSATEGRLAVIAGIMDRQEMDIDIKGTFLDKRVERRESMRRTNSVVTLEVLEKISESKRGTVLLRFVRMNMPEKFNRLLRRLWYIETHKLPSSNWSSAIVKLLTNIRRSLAFERQFSKKTITGILSDVGLCKSMPNSISVLSASWVVFDIYMESAMDAKQLPMSSAIDILTETVITLHALNQSSWQETFLALWVSGLRLVQRERDPAEGPVPHLEARLCVLLSIVPLAIANILKDDVKANSSTLQDAKALTEMEIRCAYGLDGKSRTSKRDHLISALMSLGQFSGLLCPPASVLNEANRAAEKAANAISLSQTVNAGIGSDTRGDTSLKAGGNMRHLIVEACIARNLINASAYFWPGYVSASLVSLSDSSPKEISPWSAFMEGAVLTEPLISSLVTTPATSFAEVEKVAHIALNGSVEEKAAAAKILCGASLSHGWNIQEHVVNFIVKLLSPSLGHDWRQNDLMNHMPMLRGILFGASFIDNVHILSLHGVVPEVAAALMPLCEAFGSINPVDNQCETDNQLSIYMIFAAAFLFLLRLWKFYRPPIEWSSKGEGAIGGGLSLEYLLLLRNGRIQSAVADSSPQGEMPMDVDHGSPVDHVSTLLDKPIYIDFFPKLRAWYCQNKICVASPLSGLCTGNPVHQVANRLISMVYSKMTGGHSSVNSTTSSSSKSGSPTTAGEEPSQRPLLPAWELLEAVPFALESLLTACAHGRLSSRDLTTGLRDLVDFCPALLAAIISYFSAEITRGVWKLVPMNGVDWPSPGQILPKVESDMKGVLEAAGVHLPSYPSSVAPMLPLPMAALVSLTITFKLDRSLEYIHSVVGPALENSALGSPWPSMAIISSLWAQKVRRWHHFIVASSSRSVLMKSQEAVTQVLRSCFTSFLGTHNGPESPVTSGGSINGLLGSISAGCGPPTLAPGFFYLRSCRMIQDVQHLNDVIVRLVAEFARDSEAVKTKMTSARLKSTHSSLSATAVRAREVANLGAGLLCAAGGFQLVRELYCGSIPAWLLTSDEFKPKDLSPTFHMVEGYAVAYLVFLCGGCTWGVKDQPLPQAHFTRCARVIAAHMDFLAGVVEGNVSVGNHPATLKAYVSCLVSLIVNFNPTWISEVRVETLRKLACGLRRWHETDLALSLLERGGVPAMGAIAEWLGSID